MADLFGHEAPPIAPGFVDVECEWRDETLDAIAVVPCRTGLILGDGREPWTWLPLSRVGKIDRRKNFVILTIPEWLAKEKGLL